MWCAILLYKKEGEKMGLANRESSTVPQNTTFRLTEKGRAKLQEFGPGNEGAILYALEVGGTSNAKDIAASSGFDVARVGRMLLPLKRAGYVQWTNENREE